MEALTFVYNDVVRVSDRRILQRSCDTCTRAAHAGVVIAVAPYASLPSLRVHILMQVSQYLMMQKPVLRRLYLKYSMLLVAAPEKAFKMARPQFAKFVKDGKVGFPRLICLHPP